MKKHLQYIRSRLQRNIAMVFVFVALTIAGFIRLISVNNADTRTRAQLVNLTYNISKYVQEIKSTLAESESATRDYLFTGDPAWRESVKKSHHRIKDLITEASALAKDTVQRKRLQLLGGLLEEKTAYQQSILNSDTIHPGLAARMRFDGQERSNTKTIYNTIGLFMDRQAVLLQQRTQASELANKRAQTTVIIGTAIVFIFITAILLKLNKDIRRRKQAELDIRDSEKKYRILIEDAGVTIFTSDLTGKFTYVSAKCQMLTGFTPEELTGKNFSMLVQPDWIGVVADEYMNQFRKLWDETTIEFPIVTKDGQQKWVEQHAVLLLDDLRSPIGYQCMVKDITEKRAQEEKLRESDQKMRAMLQSTLEGFYIVGPDCVVQMINDAGVRSLKMVIGKECKPGDDFMQFIRPERKNIFRKIFENILDGGTEENEVKMDTAHGEIWFHNSYFPLRNEKNEIIAVCMSSKDISERKLTEKALNRISAEREEYQFRLQSILDNTPLIIFVKDLEGRYLLVNKSFRDIMHLNDAGVIGKTDFEVDDPSKAAAYKKADEEVIRTLQSIESEEEIKDANGIRYLLKVKFPLFDKNGRIYGVGCIATDYTDKVEYREKLIHAKRKAESAERLQEEFLANMSHEIRTPMNGIIGMTNILAGTGLDHNQRELVNVIRHSSDTLLYLINDILDLSKIKSGKFSLENIGFNLNDEIETTLAPFYPKAKEKGVELSLSKVNDVVVSLEGDPHRLKQILNNLLSNALKFTEQGFISLKIKMLNETEKAVTIEFTLQDTGIGISPDKLPGIFNSFEQASSTTSRKYGGTGLGLSITKRLIEMQGGQIEVSSVPGQGSVFSFVISYARSADVPLVASEVHHQDEKLDGIKILVAEDNEINQKVIRATLAKKNIAVTIANNGKEAVEILEKNHAFDLVILDMQMPEMDGFQTATYIRRKLMLPIPILAMTASALRNEKTRCLELGMNDYLAKPFSPEELFMRLNKLLLDNSAQSTGNGQEMVANEGEWYNLSHLHEMEDNNYFCEILQLFLSDTPASIMEIKEAALYENWNEVYKKAHKIKSSLGILQMNTLLQLVATIESRAKEQQEVELIEADVKQLGELFELIRPMIESDLNNALVNV